MNRVFVRYNEIIRIFATSSDIFAERMLLETEATLSVFAVMHEKVIPSIVNTCICPCP